MTIDEMPEVIKAKHIKDHLGISLKSAYNLMNTKPEYGGVPSFSIYDKKSSVLRVDKADYIKWFEERKRKRNEMEVK